MNAAERLRRLASDARSLDLQAGDDFLALQLDDIAAECMAVAAELDALDLPTVATDASVQPGTAAGDVNGASVGAAGETHHQCVAPSDRPRRAPSAAPPPSPT